MARKPKSYTKEETIAYENRYKKQPFKQCMSDRYEWVDLTFYMIDHPSYIKLSVYATKLYTYMRKWAYQNEQWKKTGKFPYSQSMAENIGIMSTSQAKRCLDELWEKGFLDKEGYDYRNTALWSFSNRWYTGGKQTF